MRRIAQVGLVRELVMSRVVVLQLILAAFLGAAPAAAASSWELPVSVSGAPSQEALTAPVVATNGAGRGLIVWRAGLDPYGSGSVFGVGVKRSAFQEAVALPGGGIPRGLGVTADAEAVLISAGFRARSSTRTGPS